MKHSVVVGVGGYLPQRVMHNREFEAALDTSDAWIVERTGIRQRHIAAKGEMTSDLAAAAGLAALSDAKLAASDIDLLIVATSTPDETIPATATRVQHKLGMTRGAAFDVNAACSGFVYALTVADSMLRTGAAVRALVIGAETYSRIVDWNDRGTCILFGDGAGAVVLEACEQRATSNEQRGILYTRMYSDGQYGDMLRTSGGISTTQTAGTVLMQGKEVFRHAVAKMSESVNEGLAAAGATLADLDWLAPHQANARILAGVAQKLGLGEDKVLSSVARHANTSAASIPLALAEAHAAGKLAPGQLLALTALGAGLTWGSCVIRW